MDFAQQVKASADIVRVVGEFVRLKKSGTDRWVGLCPFHNEKTPSFSVNSRLQIYKCFGCGAGGDVFKFLMEHQALSFQEALAAVAEQHGIPLPRRGEAPGGDPEARLREALLAMHETARRFFAEQLRAPAGREALDYARRRGLDDETIERFGLGYAPGGNRLLALLRREGHADESIERAGLAKRPAEGGDLYDFFRDRLIFPIESQAGKTIAFAGRALRADQAAKYVNSSESPIYTKSAVLYHLHRAKEAMRRDNRVVLVEGYMDVIGAARAGVTGVVAACGTSLTPVHARALRRLADEAVVNFDADRAGLAAAERALATLLEEGFRVRVLELPGGLDPDEFCRQRGGDEYRRLIEAAPGFFTWLADRVRKEHDLASTEGRLEAFERLRPWVKLLPDGVARATAAQGLAERMGVDADLILQGFRREAAGGPRRPPPPVPAHPLSHGERLLVELFLDSPEARAEMLERAAAAAAEQALASAAILAAMRAAEAAEQGFEFAAVEGRLGERDRDILARIVFDRDKRPVSVEEGRQALAAIERRGWERDYRRARREIDEAERAGDRTRALELLARKVALERRLGMSRSAARTAG